MSRTTIRSPLTPARSQSVPSTANRLAPQGHPSVPSRTVRTMSPLPGSSWRSVIFPVGVDDPRVAKMPPATAAAPSSTAAVATSTQRRRLVRGARPASRSAATSGASGGGSATSIELNRCMRHRPSTPFSSCSPASSNVAPDPATSSFTVLVTITSAGPASAIARAPMCTPMPPSVPSTSSTSPVWTPLRTSRPISCTAAVIAAAPRNACTGSANVAKKPSPEVSCSRPPCRFSSRRTVARKLVSTTRQRMSPSSVARAVEPTTSRKSTVDQPAVPV